jgi:hypothetical protein
MDVDVYGAGRCDQAFTVPHRGARRDDQARIDAVHDGGIASLSDPDDAAGANPEIALHDADNRIDDQHVAEQEIESAFGARDTSHADAVTQRLAAAVKAFVAVGSMILLDDRH